MKRLALNNLAFYEYISATIFDDYIFDQGVDPLKVLNLFLAV